MIGIGAGVLILGILGFRAFRNYRTIKDMSEKRSQVERVQVTKQNLINSISLTGTVKSADAWDVSASAKDVEVLQVNYEAGDYVNEGDVIVVLDTTDLELSLTEAQNKQALSAYTEGKSIETASENYAEAVEDGTDTYNDAVKKEADAKEALQEAEDDLAEAASRLKRREERLAEVDAAWEPYANLTDEEVQALGDEGLEAYKTAKQDYSDAHTSYTEAHQAYTAAAEAEEKTVEAYESAADDLEKAQKNNDRNIADAADQLEKAQMEHTYSNDSSQKTIENYQEQIDSCTVTSPISGVITAMNVAVGDTYMGEGNVMFSVADQEHFVVAASVDEYDIGSIAKDMEAAVIVEAVGEDELPAAVSFVSPTASASNTGSASYEVEIALNDANTDLRIGMTAKASIVLDAAYDVLTVPYDCIETDETGRSVVYVDQNGEKTAVSVEIGMEGDYYVEISGEGLDESTMVYYATPMVNASGTGSDANTGAMMGMPMGGGAPNGGGGGAPGGRGGF